MASIYKKTVLVTGITGSWGKCLTKALLARDDIREIRGMARNEFNIVSMQREVSDPRLKLIVGDIRDERTVMDACAGVDDIFHLCAVKHVPVCEEFGMEAIKTNILGTQNLINAAKECNVKTFVDVSSDKSVEATTLYGMTKGIGEHLVINAAKPLRMGGPRFVCIRGGNALGSSGSVVPLFIKCLKEGGIVPITHPDMTRFFLSLPQAIQLVLDAAYKYTDQGCIYVTKMKACRIVDLARVIATEILGCPLQTKDVGIRTGEKLHETLISQHEVSRSYDLDNGLYVIRPTPNGDIPVNFPSYSSNDSLLDDAGIADLLRLGGWL
jgi:UDP-N-acetylglucosamine 4,6-dehydratase